MTVSISGGHQPETCQKIVPLAVKEAKKALFKTVSTRVKTVVIRGRE